MAKKYEFVEVSEEVSLNENCNLRKYNTLKNYLFVQNYHGMIYGNPSAEGAEVDLRNSTPRKISLFGMPCIARNDEDEDWAEMFKEQVEKLSDPYGQLFHDFFEGTEHENYYPSDWEEKSTYIHAKLCETAVESAEVHGAEEFSELEKGFFQLRGSCSIVKTYKFSNILQKHRFIEATAKRIATKKGNGSKVEEPQTLASAVRRLEGIQIGELFAVGYRGPDMAILRTPSEIQELLKEMQKTIAKLQH